MAVYTLNNNDLTEDFYLLIGIHTSLNECKLAYLLNKYLNLHFCKADYELDFTNKEYTSFYSVYESVNYELDQEWFLINNIYKSKSKTKTASLFAESDSISCLIPEKNKIDYFLKISGDLKRLNQLNMIEKINKIPPVITSYEVEVKSLKSKDFLIF